MLIGIDADFASILPTLSRYFRQNATPTTSAHNYRRLRHILIILALRRYYRKTLFINKEAFPALLLD